jgi:peptidoglycan hydrolase-like protein with peptidoglycan-binding domain
MSDRYCTQLSKVSDWGTITLASGAQITKLPLLDCEHENLFAHFGWRKAEAECKRLGGRLPTLQELTELRQLSLHIAPYTLPDEELAAKGYKPGDPAMQSLAWCKRHDAEVMSRILEAELTRPDAVFNAGKHWAKDGIIFGWWDGSGYIQTPSRAHVSHEQCDYATTTHCVFGIGATGDVSVPPTARRVLRYDKPMMQGDDVAIVQGLVGARVDGWYGEKTAKAVKSWQRLNRLNGDGVVGPATWSALLGQTGDYNTIKARHFTPANRGLGDIHFPTIHTIQCPPASGYARSNAQWFAGPNAPKASIHWWVGPDETIRGLEGRHRAWGAKSGPARYAQLFGLHVEHTGYTANPSRGIKATDWLGEGYPVLERSARLMARECKRWQIPIQRGDIEGFRDSYRIDKPLPDRYRGFVGHVDWTRAYAIKGGHYDPGEAWPWREYLDLVERECNAL